jgi:very-short-patch-repair endonuclease
MRYADLEGIAYEHQFILETRKGAFTFDFYLPAINLLVEADGEYWHRKSLEVWNRDVLKGRLAEEMGYRVLRISDKDWRPDLVHGSAEAIEAHTRALLEERRVYFADVQSAA